MIAFSHMMELQPLVLVGCGVGGLLLVIHGMARARAEAVKLLDLYGGLLKESREIAKSPTETRPGD